MAKYRRGKKMQPAEMTFTFETTVGSALTKNYIDLSQCASLLNRRFYRQGINWAVSQVKVINLSPQVGAQMALGKLPNTWVMSNAYEKSFRVWQRMNNEALSETESVRPRFLDFKIYADTTHHTQGFGANLLPRGQDPGTFATAGEWEPSKIVQPKTDGTNDVQERELIATGANYPGTSPASGKNAVSIIEGYAASRGLPNVLDPNAPGDASQVDGNIPANWMASIFNQGTDQTEAVVEDMITENNLAPYPFENDGTSTDTQYPGGANQITGLAMHDFEIITASTVGATTRFKGGNFPCGLLSIATAQFAPDSNIVIQVELVPGDHRGYMCQSMLEA